MNYLSPGQIKRVSFTHQRTYIPCSTVLLLGGSCGSCLTLRAEEDVTEEERDEPPWRWPLTQNKMIVKQTDKKKELERGLKKREGRGKLNKSKKEKNGDKKKKGKME